MSFASQITFQPFYRPLYRPRQRVPRAFKTSPTLLRPLTLPPHSFGRQCLCTYSAGHKYSDDLRSWISLSLSIVAIARTVVQFSLIKIIYFEQFFQPALFTILLQPRDYAFPRAAILTALTFNTVLHYQFNQSARILRLTICDLDG